MSTKPLTASILLVSLLLFGAPSFEAQVSEKEKQEKELARKQLLKRKTYALVEEIANGSLSLKLAENRSYLLAASADLLWDHDEPRARNLFWDAVNTITLMNPPVATRDTKPTEKDKLQAQSLYFQIFALRHGVLRQVARHDAQLALDMLRSSRQPPLESPSPGYVIPEDHELEQQIAAEAAEVASRDPQRAFQLAQEALAKGLSWETLNLLNGLNQKDAALGSKFAGDVIDKLRVRNLTTDPHGGYLAVALLTSSRAPAVEAEQTPRGAPVWRNLKLEDGQRRDLVEMITNAAQSGSANGRLLFNLEEIMPEIEQFTPERVALIQKKLAAFNQTLNKEQKISQEYNALFRNGTPEDMLKLAARSPGDRDWMQQQAVVMAVMKKRADSLREFINSGIDDEDRRKTLTDMLDAEQIDYAVNKGDVEGLRKLLPQVRRKEERARAMVEIAIVMEKNGGHEEALKLLDEAQTMIKLNLESVTQTNAMLALMAGYALVEPNKAFTMVERIIDRANDDVGKLLLLDKIISSGIVKRGEIRLQNSGMMSVDFAVFKYGKGVAALANADFDRTKAAADRFQRNELRLLVRLLLAQALLRADNPPLTGYEK